MCLDQGCGWSNPGARAFGVDSQKTTRLQDAPRSTQSDPDDLQLVADCTTYDRQPILPAVTHEAMDAAGPVDGAHGRAAHKVLGNRSAIPTAPTAQTDSLSNGLERNGETTDTLPATRGGRF